jgi:tRNA pseudouridine13 synthase
VLAPCAAWCAGLEAAGLDQERRALIARPEAAALEWLADDAVALRFVLPRGVFATAVLRELVSAAPVSDVPEAAGSAKVHRAR